MSNDQPPLFLNGQELFELTGRRFKSLQIKQLKRMLIPFHVNALGRPVVARAAITGAQNAVPAPPQKWEPNMLRNR